MLPSPPPTRTYNTIPPASPEVRDWFRRQILSAHYVTQGKGFEALSAIEQREIVLRYCGHVLDSIQEQMRDEGELVLRNLDGLPVYTPGPNIPDHPCAPRGSRPGRNLSAPLVSSAPVSDDRQGPKCPNCGAPDIVIPGTCQVCKASVTRDASGYNEIEIDPAAERVRFIAAHGRTPEEEIDRVRAAGMDWSADGLARYYRAMLLESRSTS